ncbi:MAG: 50S ribosomal protein L35 [Endomicrobium sp.]|jgi:large subunit ribosomal protein L35|nr:50S ribosomal protein L35 [Endomicrobium sp.]
MIKPGSLSIDLNWGGVRVPKMKTRSCAKKRFKVTGTGKVKYKKPGQRHLMTGDSGNQNRRSRKAVIVADADMKVMKKVMPYSF